MLPAARPIRYALLPLTDRLKNPDLNAFRTDLSFLAIHTIEF